MKVVSGKSVQLSLDALGLNSSVVAIPPVGDGRLSSKMAPLTTEVAGVELLDIVPIYESEPSWRDYVQMQLCGIHWDWLTICSCRLALSLLYCSGSC